MELIRKFVISPAARAVLICFSLELFSFPFHGKAHALPSESTRETYEQILTMIQLDSDPSARKFQASILMEDALSKFNLLEETGERTRFLKEIYLGMKWLNGDPLGKLEGRIYDYCLKIDDQQVRRIVARINFLPGRFIMTGCALPLGVAAMGEALVVPLSVFFSQLSFALALLFYGGCVECGNVRNIFRWKQYTTVTEGYKQSFFSHIGHNQRLDFPYYVQVLEYLELLLKRKSTEAYRLREVEEIAPPNLIGFDEGGAMSDSNCPEHRIEIFDSPCR